MFGIQINTYNGNTLDSEYVKGVMSVNGYINMSAKSWANIYSIDINNLNKGALCSFVGHVGSGNSIAGCVSSYDGYNKVLKLYNSGLQPITLLDSNNITTNRTGEYGIDFGEGFSTITEGFKSLRLIYSGKGTIETLTTYHQYNRRETRVVRVSVVSKTKPIVFSLIRRGSDGSKLICAPLGTVSLGDNHDFYFVIKEYIYGNSGGSSGYTVYDENKLYQHFYVFSSDPEYSKQDYGIEVFNKNGELVYGGDYITANIAGYSLIPFVSRNGMDTRNQLKVNISNNGYNIDGKSIAVNIIGSNVVSEVFGDSAARILFPRFTMEGNQIVRTLYQAGMIGQPNSPGSNGQGYYYVSEMMRLYTASGFNDCHQFINCIDVTNLPEYFGENSPRLNPKHLYQ